MGTYRDASRGKGQDLLQHDRRMEGRYNIAAYPVGVFGSLAQ
jgi:hypothetical protein